MNASCLVDECKRLVDECKRLVDECKHLVDEGKLFSRRSSFYFHSFQMPFWKVHDLSLEMPDAP